MPVPFLGRLNVFEYVALVGSFLLVGLESLIRIVTLAMPTTLLNLFYHMSRSIFNKFESPAQKTAEKKKQPLSTAIRNAGDFVDLCAIFGYAAEEHVVQTKDGYLLGLHRLPCKKGEGAKVNSGPNSTKKRVVYLHHGLLMNSEVWVCLTEEQKALPFVLVERGFDVWLGNNRGNKYSKKSIHYPPNSTKFWDFSIDEFAFHDIPDSIAYILETTRQESLSYIGFSQGTAQAFAALSIHPRLNEQVNVFIALAPAMSPAGLSNSMTDAMVKASPQVLYLLFGRRTILGSAIMWQSLLYPPLFARVIDLALAFLFGWQTRNIMSHQKIAAYPHLYSYTSTKSVVHWFQIMRTKSFQMFDDEVQGTMPALLSGSKYTKVAKYPTRNIRTPIVLVYGGSDSLVDIKVMLSELPDTTVATEIPHYEHLDFLWARDVDSQVFQHVFDALESFTGAEHTQEEYERFRSARHASLHASASFRRYDPAARASADGNDSEASTAVAGGDAASGAASSSGDEKGGATATSTRRVLSRTTPPPSAIGTTTTAITTTTKALHTPHQARESRIHSPTTSRGSGGGAAAGLFAARARQKMTSSSPLPASSPSSPNRAGTSPGNRRAAVEENAEPARRASAESASAGTTGSSVTATPGSAVRFASTRPQVAGAGAASEGQLDGTTATKTTAAGDMAPPSAPPVTPNSPSSGATAMSMMMPATSSAASSVAGDESPSAQSLKRRSLGSAGQLSLAESLKGGRGISLGAGRAAGGVLTTSGAGAAGLPGGADSEEGARGLRSQGTNEPGR